MPSDSTTPSGTTSLGGSSRSNPSVLRRWLTSLMMRHLSSPLARRRQRERYERRRRKSGAPHRVEYFHQIDDPYSYLAAQMLPPLTACYDIELVVHLVTGPADANAPEPDLLLPYSHRDCVAIAPHYGLQYPDVSGLPAAQRVELANRIAAGLDPEALPQILTTVGESLYGCGSETLEEMAQRVGAADDAETRDRLAAGDSRRRELGHYSGAMFYYGGEWYWGVDRLYHLENRLLELGLGRDNSGQLLLPRPDIEFGPLQDTGTLTLEVYPSLRSPYTSIIFDRAVSLAEQTGVSLSVRPVLPMVMRGVPVTREKGKYIFFDTAREAETLGMSWGDAWDPIGEPVRRAFALYPWADRQGRGVALLSSFMRLVFRERVNVASLRGMRAVVEDAGLDWEEALQHLEDTDWQALLEGNRRSLYELGIWGVPSFRLLDASGGTVLATWGQDRLWLVAREIQRQLRAEQG